MMKRCAAVMLLALSMLLQCGIVQAQSLESYNFRIIPREVQSIVARLCDSSSQAIAARAYDVLGKSGYDALMEQTRNYAARNLDEVSQTKKTLRLKETLMFAVVARLNMKGNAQGQLKEELDNLLFKTMNDLCTCVSNLDKIIYFENGKVNKGAYDALLRKVEGAARESRKPDLQL